MDKKKMTKKGTHIVKRLLAAVCTVALVLGLMPGNLGTMSVQAEATTIKLSEISGTTLAFPTQLSVGATIINDMEGCTGIKLMVYGSKRQDGSPSSLTIDNASEYQIKGSYGSYTTDYKWEAYCKVVCGNEATLYMWPAADTRTETTTTLSADSITVTEGEAWTLTAQAKAGGVDIEGATVVYYSDAECNNELDATPTAVGTYYARGEYAGNDSYKASNSEAIPIYINAPIDTETQINASDLVIGQTYKAGMQIANTFEVGVAFTGYEDFQTYGVRGDNLYILHAFFTDSNDTLPTSGSYTSRQSPMGPNNEPTEVEADEWIYGGIGGGLGYIFYAPKYTVSLTNASSDVSLCYVRTSVTITADAAPEGKEFSGWTGLDGITITSGSASTETVTFTMPAKDVSITANYKDEGTAPTDPTTPTEPKDNVAKVGDSDNSGTLTVKSDIDSSAPKTTVATKASDIVNILKQDGTLTAGEIKDINDGNSDVEVILGVTNNKDSISTASKDLIKEKAEAEGMTIAEYMDITLTKYIIPTGKTRADVSGTKIEKLTNGSIAITVTIPDSFKNTDASKIRTYYVLRNHDGEVTVLNGTLSSNGNEFTFTTDKFSDYVLTYKDTAKSADDGGSNSGDNGNNDSSNSGGNNGGNNGNSSSNDNTAATTTTTNTTTTNTTTTADSPKTGDGTPVAWLFVLLFGSAAGLFAINGRKLGRKNQ